MAIESRDAICTRSVGTYIELTEGLDKID
jgi:hypothetical protein